MKNKKNNAQYELYKEIYDIVISVKGNTNFSTLKCIFLTLLFYRYLSERITSSINNEERTNKKVVFDYATLDDKTGEQYRDRFIANNCYFLLPSELFNNVKKNRTSVLFYQRLIEVLHSLDFLFSSNNRVAKESCIDESMSDFFSFHLNEAEDDKRKIVALLEDIFDAVARLPVSIEIEDSKTISFAEAFVYIMCICNANVSSSKISDYLGTNTAMAKLLTGIVMAGNRYINGIYDPACGAATLFSELSNSLAKDERAFYGQDVNSSELCLARMNMFIHDVKINRLHFNNSDSLIAPMYSANKNIPFNTIVSHLPFNIRCTGKDEEVWRNLKVELPKTASDIGFWVLISKIMKKDTIAALTCFPGVLYRGGTEAEIRKYLIENGFIDCVIKLPAAISNSGNIELNIVVMKLNKAEDDIRFIDASQEYFVVEGKSIVTVDNIKNIIGSYTGNANDGISMAIASKEKIASLKYSLAVSNYIDESGKIQKKIKRKLSEIDDETRVSYSLLSPKSIATSKDNKRLEDISGYRDKITEKVALERIETETVKFKLEVEKIIDEIDYEWHENCIDLEVLKRSIAKDDVFKLDLNSVGECKQGSRLVFEKIEDCNLENGYVPFVQVQDFGDDINLVAKPDHFVAITEKEKGTFVPEGAVLFTLAGSEKKIAVAPYDCYIDRDIYVIQNLRSDIYARYLAFQLQAKLRDEEDLLAEKLSKTSSSVIELYFPNLSVQEKIVYFLDQLNIANSALMNRYDKCKAQHELQLEQLLATENDEKNISSSKPQIKKKYEIFFSLCKEKFAEIQSRLSNYRLHCERIKLNLLVEFWRILFADKKDWLGLNGSRSDVTKMWLYIDKIDGLKNGDDEGMRARYWRKAASLGYTDALEELSDFCFNRNKYDEAKEFLLKYAAGKRKDKGEALLLSLYLGIGDCYYNNISPYYYDKRIEQYTKASHWYKQAADLGSEYGLKMLGESYKKLGNEEDEGRECKKLYYYEQATLCGCEVNMGMGDCYYFGWGTEPDYAKADEYYLKSIFSLKPFELYELSYIYLKRDKIEKYQTRAVECWKVLADKEWVEAFDELGFAYYLGKGVEKDEQKALEYFKKAKEKHDGYNIGRCWGNTQEKRKINNWFKKLGKKGYRWK